MDDVIPQGDKLDPQKFLSNNQVYTKKEEIEYGKKSHLEYLKKIAQNKDPLNVAAKGGLRPITREEVAQHNTPESLWTILNGKVYDLSMYLDYHPGGRKKLLLGAGTDCTELFSNTLLI
jgi:cytochrome b involved in lipid metabolism